MRSRLLYAGRGTRQLISGLRQLRVYQTKRRFLSEARNAVKEVLPAISPIAGMPPPMTWAIKRVLSTTTDLCVISLRPADEDEPVAVLKLARSPEAVTAMRREIEVLRELTADSRLEELHPLLPRVLACGDVQGRFVLLEQALPGLDAREVLSDPATAQRVQARAASVVGLLHRRTAAAVVVDRTLTDYWIDQPMLAVRALEHNHPSIARRARSIDALVDELREALLGRRLVVTQRFFLCARLCHRAF